MVLESLVRGSLDPSLELLDHGDRWRDSQSRSRRRGRCRQRREKAPGSTGAVEQRLSEDRCHDRGSI